MKSVTIRNLVLVDCETVDFSPKLNIITGETGSGKSALLEALKLINGSKSDVNLIKNGSEIASVEVKLDSGVILRREVHKNGKSRCFIDDQLVTIKELKEQLSMEIVDQNAAKSAFSACHLLLDSFANLHQDRIAIENLDYSIKKQEKALLQLEEIPHEKKLQSAKDELKIIEEINYSEKEEMELNEEHELLHHKKKLFEKLKGAECALENFGSLKQASHLLEQASHIHARLNDEAKSLKSAVLEIEEIARSVSFQCDALENQFERLSIVEERIGAFHALKRRFGDDLEGQKKHLMEEIDFFSNIEEKKSELRDALEKEKEEQRKKFHALLEKRKVAATVLEKKMLEELRPLNLESARFVIEVNEGLKSVCFYFSANPGNELMPIEEIASGGELSRVLLCLKILLSHQSTLVFDEIDSNVGGISASILGEKLAKLAEHTQVIAVTHFVQVAKHADRHFLVRKVLERMHSFTKITQLEDKELESEYSRMLGKTP